MRVEGGSIVRSDERRGGVERRQTGGVERRRVGASGSKPAKGTVGGEKHTVRREEKKVLKERRSRRERGRMGTSQREENGRALNFPPHMHCPPVPVPEGSPPWIMKFLIER